MVVDEELRVINQIREILDDFPDVPGRTRIVRWLADRYGQVIEENRVAYIGRQNENKMEEGQNLLEWFDAVKPASDRVRVLLVSYFMQTRKQKQALRAKEVNGLLRSMGLRVSNITAVFRQLIDIKPQLALEFGKKSRVKQAQKNYQLTAAGIKMVEEMLRK